MNEATNTAQIYQGDEVLRKKIATIIQAHNLSQSAVAKEAAVSPTTLSQWLNGNYKGNNETVDTKMRQWVDAHNARVAAGDQLPEVPDFVDTPTANRVIAALSYAQVAGDIAMAYGAPGIGKTSAIKQYAATHPNVWHVTLSPASSGVVPALEDICTALGLTAGSGARRMYLEICKRVGGTHGLIVIDESQHASPQALEQIRAIHDATDIGLAFCGNDGIYSQMAGGRNTEKLDRLRSRVGKRLSLKKPSEADVKALVKAWGITDEKCMPVLLDIAARPGALRALNKVLRLASMEASAQGRSICCSDVRAAARELGGAA